MCFTSQFDLVLLKVIFFPNFLFFSFFPLWFPSPSPNPLIFQTQLYTGLYTCAEKIVKTKKGEVQFFVIFTFPNVVKLPQRDWSQMKHATQHLALLVRPSVLLCESVHKSITLLNYRYFTSYEWVWLFFCITASAEPSVTLALCSCRAGLI